MSIITMYEMNSKVSDLIINAIKSGYKIVGDYSYTRNTPAYDIMLAKLINKKSGNEIYLSVIDYRDRYRIYCKSLNKDSLVSWSKFNYYKIRDNIFSDNKEEANKFKFSNKLTKLDDYIKLNDVLNKQCNSINYNNYNTKTKFNRLIDYI